MVVATKGETMGTDTPSGETDFDWSDVEHLIGDLNRDGYDVDSIRTNGNPVSGDKLLLIEVTRNE